MIEHSMEPMARLNMYLEQRRFLENGRNIRTKNKTPGGAFIPSTFAVCISEQPTSVRKGHSY